MLFHHHCHLYSNVVRIHFRIVLENPWRRLFDRWGEIVFSRELIDVEWKAFLDYILVYEDKRATTIDELAMNIAPPVNNEENDKITLELQKQKTRHRMFKRRFLVNLAKVGLVMETVYFEEISLE